MKEHIDILQLLDYVQGKITDEAQYDHITDHLCDCEICRQVLRSHYSLISNYSTLIGKFFPKSRLSEKEAEAGSIMQPGLQSSPSGFMQTISDMILGLRKHGGHISQEIREEFAGFLESIRSLPNMKILLVPLKMKTITLLGVEETEKKKELEMKYLSGNIILHFIPFYDFKKEDFTFEFTGKFFYLSCEKENYKILIGRKVNLMTDLGSPFIFTAAFEEKYKNVIARFKIEFDEILSAEDANADKNNYPEFFLNIE